MGRSVVRWMVIGLVLAACAGDRLPTREAKPAGPPPAADLADSRTIGVTAGEAAAGPGKDQERTPFGPIVDQPMIIRTGQVSIRVDSLEVAIRMVSELATRVGGFLANTSIQTGEGSERTATLELKVPADRYTGALEQLRAIGKIMSATTNAQDVGEEFVDVTARVANARRLEQRLLQLLATRTGKLEDVLGVERELARVREEIERYDGRIRFLKAKVATSTLAISLFEPGPIVGNPGTNPIVEAFRQSWRNLVTATAALIGIAGGLVPVAALGTIAFLIYRRVRRKEATA